MFVQTGPNRWTDGAVAAQLGLRRYVPTAASAAKRAVPAPLKPAASALKRVVPVKPSASPARSQPRDIPEALAIGLPNQAINQLVAKGILLRPKSLVDASAALWPVGAWQVAEQRGLVW